jgi:hypothetical protein
MNDIKTLVMDFAGRLQTLIESEVIDRARGAVLVAMGIPAPKRMGRPPRAATASPSVATARKKPPLQLCPVPGCKNAAAPIFGMVCAKHKDLPKATIKKYREARRAKKLKGAGRRSRKRQVAKTKRVSVRPQAGRTSPASSPWCKSRPRLT